MNSVTSHHRTARPLEDVHFPPFYLNINITHLKSFATGCHRGTTWARYLGSVWQWMSIYKASACAGSSVCVPVWQTQPVHKHLPDVPPMKNCIILLQMNCICMYNFCTAFLTYNQVHFTFRSLIKGLLCLAASCFFYFKSS